MSRETLMAVSARLFARGGFDATSMRDIAGEAGMLAGSMYYHFPSKNDLIAAVYEEGVAEISAAVDAAVTKADTPWTRLEAACVAHLQSLLSDAAHAAVMTADVRRLDARLRRRLIEEGTSFRALQDDAAGFLCDRRLDALVLLGR